MRAEEKFERYVKTPPLIAVEILSPEDTLRAMQEKAAEYRFFGVENIWIIDPEPRMAYTTLLQASRRSIQANSPCRGHRSVWCSARCLRSWTGSKLSST